MSRHLPATPIDVEDLDEVLDLDTIDDALESALACALADAFDGTDADAALSLLREIELGACQVLTPTEQAQLTVQHYHRSTERRVVFDC